jgi:hypothetical protein
MLEKPTNVTIIHSVYGINYVWCLHHVTILNTPIHNILPTAPQLNISQKSLGTLSEDGKVMPKNVGATIHNE